MVGAAWLGFKSLSVVRKIGGVNFQLARQKSQAESLRHDRNPIAIFYFPFNTQLDSIRLKVAGALRGPFAWPNVDIKPVTAQGCAYCFER